MEFPYFKIKEAFDEMRSDFNYGDTVDKASSVAKLLGKTVANIGMLSAELGIEVIKSIPEHVEKSAERTLKK